MARFLAQTGLAAPENLMQSDFPAGHGISFSRQADITTLGLARQLGIRFARDFAF
jgi:hypothetical protein